MKENSLIASVRCRHTKTASCHVPCFAGDTIVRSTSHGEPMHQVSSQESSRVASQRGRLPGRLSLLIVMFCSLLIMLTSMSPAQSFNRRFGLAVHGGAGTILKASMTPEMENQYRDKLTEAISAGYAVLKNNGTSLDAVETVIKILEDSPLFNAGKGAVFTHEGTNELDAAIMDGRTLKAGAVAAVKHIKNPISLARMVMEESPHVMLVGDGAEEFAKAHGVGLVPPEYFYTERRWKQLQEAKAKEDSTGHQPRPAADSSDHRHGTVGCVALDMMGNLAAGTSTGGTTNKRFGGRS